MKLSDFGTNKQNKKFCELITKTAISCVAENKCDFEIAKLKDGDFLFKSPKTRNKLVRASKKAVSEIFCGRERYIKRIK